MSTDKSVIYDAIIQFVDDLWDIYGDEKKVTPLALYRRLLKKSSGDTATIDKAIAGFQEFFNTYDSKLIDNNINAIPQGVTIKYNNNAKVCIEIQKYIYKSKDPEVQSAISLHLLTISDLIVPDDRKKKLLVDKPLPLNELGIDTSCPEGEFMGSIMEKVKNMDIKEGADLSNPMSLLMNPANMGMMKEMFAGIQQGVGSKKLNGKKMMKMMKGVLDNLADKFDDGEEEKHSN